MQFAIAAIFGGLGGLLLEGVETARHLRRYGRVPWSRSGDVGQAIWIDGELRRYESLQTFLLAVAIRTAVGAIVALLLRTAGELGDLAAAVSGAGAYGIVDRWASSTDVNGGEPELQDAGTLVEHPPAEANE